MENAIIAKPEEVTIPILVSVPHAGTAIPEDAVDLVADPNVLYQHTDFYIDKLYDFVAGKGGILIKTQIQRCIIDVNRDKDGAEQVTKDPRQGLVWMTTKNEEQIHKRALSQEELDERISKYYDPYHSILQEQIHYIKSKFGYVVVIEGHSMPSVGGKLDKDSGKKRPDIVVGDFDGKSCSQEITKLVINHFVSRGYTVSLNWPFKGGFITRKYGKPKKDIHVVQIELNKSIYMNEDTREVTERLSRTRNDLSELVNSFSRRIK